MERGILKHFYKIIDTCEPYGLSQLPICKSGNSDRKNGICVKPQKEDQRRSQKGCKPDFSFF